MITLSILAVFISLFLLSLDFFGVTGKIVEDIDTMDDVVEWICENDTLISLDSFSPGYWDGFETPEILTFSNLSSEACLANLVSL